MIQAALGLVPLQKIFPNKIVSILCKEKKNCKIMQTTKKKYTQNDLRRLMSEQKAKAAPKVVQNKIDSPLAKYPFHKKKTILFDPFNLFTILPNWLIYSIFP